MPSIKAVYSHAFAVLKKQPFRLLGLLLLALLLGGLSWVLCGVVPILAIAVSLLLETALTLVFLRCVRGEEIAAVQLFDTFRDWKTIRRVLCGIGWMSLWIFLWALIPFAGIVFAVIRMYEYRFTPYILLCEPEVPVTEAIKVSRQRTLGHKGKMFGADLIPTLAFIALHLLLLLPAALLSHTSRAVSLYAFLYVLLIFAAGWLLLLFLGLVQAVFYEKITNRSICPRCGVELADGARFCYCCGYSTDGANAADASAETVSCPQCGAPVKAGSSFCTQCGCRMS